MEYLPPKEIEKKLPPNTIDTDFRAELFLALLCEAGFGIGDIVTVRKGNCGGNVSKEIASVRYRRLFDIVESPYIEIKTRRPGIYDLLPEELFHASLYPGKVKDKESILGEMSQHWEEEFYIRRLFSLFENEIDRGAVESQLLELRFDKKNKYRNYTGIFSRYWPVIGKMRTRDALLLVKIIPHVHLIRRDLGETAEAFSLILGAPVTITPETGCHPVKGRKPNRIGNMRLGVDSVTVGSYADAETDLHVHIGDLPARDTERFLPGNPSRVILEELADLFFGADKDYRVTISAIPSERKALLKSENNAYPCYLGINTYL